MIDKSGSDLFFGCPGNSHKLSENPEIWLVDLRFGREDDATVRTVQQNYFCGWQLGLRERCPGPKAG